MIRRVLVAAVLTAGLWALGGVSEAKAQQAYGNIYNRMPATNWQRFYHYPYVFYPQNFYGADYYDSRNDLYWRYPPEMQIPVYNRQWHNYYPQTRRYHRGHHFILDVF